MSNQVISSDLLVELSTDEQQTQTGGGFIVFPRPYFGGFWPPRFWGGGFWGGGFWRPRFWGGGFWGPRFY